MQQVIVQKFGGTSVSSGERIAAVAEIIKNEAEMNTVVVVVSAMAGAVSYTHLTLPTICSV